MFALLGGIARIGQLVLVGIGAGKIIDFFNNFTSSGKAPTNNSTANIVFTVLGIGILAGVGYFIYRKLR